MLRSTIARVALLLWLVLLCGMRVNAQTKLEAAFTYQFTKLIEWGMGGKTGDFKIAVVGTRTPVFEELVKLNGRRVGSQTVEVVEVPSVSSAGKCNILYLPKTSGANDLSQAVAASKGTTTLVISAHENDFMKGAGISFSTSGGRLAFQLNTTRLKNDGFKLSDQLVKLAKDKI